MPNSLDVGDLSERVHLQSRGMVDDGFGTMVPGGDFVTQHTVWGRLLPLRGTETVIAARLEGRQPYVITVRRSINTRQVTPDWRIVDARDERRVFAIKAPPTDPDGSRSWIDFLCELGGES